MSPLVNLLNGIALKNSMENKERIFNRNVLIDKFMGVMTPEWRSMLVSPYDADWNLLHGVVDRIDEIACEDFENVDEGDYTDIQTMVTSMTLNTERESILVCIEKYINWYNAQTKVEK